MSNRMLPTSELSISPRLLGHRLGGQVRDHFRERRLQLGGTRLLVLGLVSVVDLGVGESLDARDQRFVLGWRIPVDFRLAAVAHQVMDRVDDRFHLVVAEDDGAEHDFFGQLLGFGLDHQDGGLGTGNDQVHLARLELGGGRVEDVLAIGVTDARGADRAGERHARHAQRGRCADHGGDVRIDLRIDRQHVDDDLDFVEVAFREQRTDRTVDQARGQRLFFGRTAFALEEAARDLAGCVGLLDVIDGQREEILARLGVFARYHGRQDDGVFDRHQHGAGCLTSDLAGFQGDLMLAVLECFRDFVKHGYSLSNLPTDFQGLSFTSPQAPKRRLYFFDATLPVALRNAKCPRQSD